MYFSGLARRLEHCVRNQEVAELIPAVQRSVCSRNDSEQVVRKAVAYSLVLAKLR